MKIFTRVFIHGLDSSSRGTKGCFFRERYPGMFMEDYFGPLKERMAQLERDLSGKRNLIMVGSSYGGLMATIFACRNETRVRRLILLAPALGHADFGRLFPATSADPCHPLPRAVRRRRSPRADPADRRTLLHKS